MIEALIFLFIYVLGGYAAIGYSLERLEEFAEFLGDAFDMDTRLHDNLAAGIFILSIIFWPSYVLYDMVNPQHV